MCANENCPYEYGISIIGTQRSAIDLLWQFELSRFGPNFQFQNELSVDDENRLIDAAFPYRNLCWGCARTQIENAMQWRFSWLDRGIWLTEHAALLQNIEKVQPISGEWIEFLILNSVGEWICEYTNEDLGLVFQELELRRVNAEQVIDICTWYKQSFGESIELDHLLDLLRDGYRDSEFLKSLDREDVYRLIVCREVPPLKVLSSLGGKLDEFFLMQSVYWNHLYEDNDACQFIERLIELNVGIVLLRELAEDLLEDDDMQVVIDEFDDYFQDFMNRSFSNQFLESIVQIRQVGFELTRENLIQYWGMSSELILYVVDNGLLSEDILRIARVVDKPSELVSWLKNGFDLIPYDEVRDWVKFGFLSNDAHEWCSSGFDAETANIWRKVTDNSVAARRRLEAGIQPPSGDL
jgi:hypothetical protein